MVISLGIGFPGQWEKLWTLNREAKERVLWALRTWTLSRQAKERVGHNGPSRSIWD